MIRPLPLFLALALLGGCEQRADVGPVVVSTISGAAELTDAAKGPHTPAARLLTNAVAQGLVRFDASGQIEPGLAERWIVIDDGMSYIFRLRDAVWSDGKPVTAAQVVTVLNRQLSHGSDNPLRPYLSAIDEIVEMTPQVIEVRLSRPRPDLLKLFAQPELAIFRANPPGGTGPMRIKAHIGSQWLLTPVPDPDADEDDDSAKPSPEDDVRLIPERAARAITRFATHQSDLVTDGSFTDWPLLAYSDVAPTNIKVDPAAGLFGLALVSREGFLADPAHRAAVAEALDRDALVAAIVPNWPATLTVLPEQLDSAAQPALPGWASQPLAGRIAAARATVAKWQAQNPTPLTLRVALPQGPGANLVYGQIGLALQQIGITPQRVAEDADADLRLIDRVAPFDSARWYLVNACQPCGGDVVAKIAAARDAQTMAARAQAIALADRALAADAAFIPIARPLRWNLVAQRLRQFQGNSRAWHPLNRLRNDTR
jgi:peptide/nickel transport system substrate-binding protein